jgi:hypothetical protein
MTPHGHALWLQDNKPVLLLKLQAGALGMRKLPPNINDTVILEEVQLCHRPIRTLNITASISVVSLRQVLLMKF